MNRLLRVVFALPFALLLGGCIHPPEIVMVDRATALEEQAAGSFDELERNLTRAGITPHPVPLTPADLEALGMRSPPLVEGADLTDAERVDDLLRQHCLGEGRDGLLADTHDACRSSAADASLTVLVERVNRARQQLWRWMHDERPDAKVEDLRQSWQRIHAAAVVCGGWWQRADGGWEAKKC
jgi:uncharacterized protein YdbL (DUF1318 family)